jgi:hypothetical protein
VFISQKKVADKDVGGCIFIACRKKIVQNGKENIFSFNPGLELMTSAHIFSKTKAWMGKN